MTIDKQRGNLAETTTIIKSGETISSVIDCFNTILTVITIPTEFTGTIITFKVSFDGINFYDYYAPNGDKISLDINTGSAIGIVPADFAGIQYLKIISNATEISDREIKLWMRKVA